MSSFKEFLEGRAKYRQSVISGKPTAYTASVPDLDPAVIVEPGASIAANRLGSLQQAADMVAADKRARDMRAMTFEDLRRCYADSHVQQEIYEKSRLARFDQGML